MDLVGRLAVFQHSKRDDDPWNGRRVRIVASHLPGWYEIHDDEGSCGSSLAMREELTLVDES